MVFDYPGPRTSRRHEPRGYQDYESYRPWLRDEFVFLCVYCLKREVWGSVTGEFELDHFRPQAVNPELRYDYHNLVYACRRCNLVKLDQMISDPIHLLHSEFVTYSPDGSIQTNESETERLIRQLDLNSPRLKKWRIMWSRIVQLAKEKDPQLYFQLVGFPEDLPNLSRLRPPENRRKEGISESWFELRQRGELPEAY